MAPPAIRVLETLKSRAKTTVHLPKKCLRRTHKFSHYLEGRAFIIFTDRKPPTISMTSKLLLTTPTPTLPLRFRVHDGHQTSVRHNTVADALFRPVDLANFVQPVDEDEITRKQKKDPEIRAFRRACTNLRFEDITIPNTDNTVLCEILTGKRPVVSVLQRKAFN